MIKRRADYQQKGSRKARSSSAKSAATAKSAPARKESDAPRSQSGLGDATPIARLMPRRKVLDKADDARLHCRVCRLRKWQSRSSGPRYELSLVVCGDSLAQRMNKIYRKKTYKPNVLSFLFSKTEGEIFLNVQCAKREAKKYGTTLQKRSHNDLCTKCLCRSPWNKGFLGISLTQTISYDVVISAISYAAPKPFRHAAHSTIIQY